MLTVIFIDDLEKSKKNVIGFIIWSAVYVLMHCGIFTELPQCNVNRMSANVTRTVKWSEVIIENHWKVQQGNCEWRVTGGQTLRVRRTFPSCPASVLSGIQPGWLHTLAVLSYAPVNRKWPSVAAPGRKEGKTFEIIDQIPQVQCVRCGAKWVHYVGSEQ